MRLFPRPGRLTTAAGRFALLTQIFTGFTSVPHGGTVFRLFPKLGTLDRPAGRLALITQIFGRGALGFGLSIRRAVVAAMLGDSRLAVVVGDRVFDRFIPNDVAGRPAVTSTLLQITRPRNLDGPDGTARARFRFKTIAPLDATPTAGEAGELDAELVRQIFDGLTNVSLDVPGDDPVYLLEVWSEGDADTVEAATDAGEPYLITSFDYVFRFRERVPRT